MDPYTDDAQSAPSGPDDSGEVANKPDVEQDDGRSALIPKSLIEGKQPGDTVTFKVVHLYEDDAEIECVDEKQKEEPDKSQTDQSTDALDALATEQ